MALVAYAQPPRCDTCHFDYDHTWNPSYIDSVVVYSPPFANEFQPCQNDTVKMKNITFIHGLGGSANSWAKQAVWTGNNYKTGKTNVNYDANLQSSFDYIGDELLEPQITKGSDQMTKTNPGRCLQNDFAIAHSQGGIAARFLDWQWDVNTNGDFGIRGYYGLVTFGTPHAGADIAFTKEQHKGFIQEIVSAIYLERGYGLVYDFSQSIVGRFLGLKGSDLVDKIDGAIENQLAPVMLASIQAPTLDEMAPGSPTMNSINNHKSRLRKVAFYGIEDAPECWKIVSNMTDTASEDYPLWEAERDYHFQEKMEKARYEHETVIQELGKEIRVRGDYMKIPILKKLLSTKKYNELVDEKNHRERAITFLNNANTQWRYLIGSYHRDSFETKTINKYIVKWDEKYGWFLSKWYHQERSFYNYDDAVSYSKTIHGQVYQIKNQEIATVQETREVQQFFPSDGVVLVRSQRAFPGVGGRVDKMEHNNHFQERNSPETEILLLKLYNGKYDSYFKTIAK
ncbi:MAG: hypothetical protein COA58_07500 [Bacteroidetes bacterium]|nr:MAG: hypothetical protein COA58_07500 [Bacteroidota bacterium]